MLAEQSVQSVAASVKPPTRYRKVRVFLSYRRQDSSGYAGHLYDDLAAHFGNDAVFMDLKIPGGADFVEQIEAGVGSCDALLHLIGPRWIDARDESGNRRLDDPQDYTRTELARALERGVRVIPVLVGGARMPQPDALPADIRGIVRLQAVELTDSRWDYDVGELLAALDERRTPMRRRRKAIAGAVVALITVLAVATAIAVGLFAGRDSPRPTSDGKIRPAQIATGSRPVAVTVGENAVWVANQADGTVTRIDPSTRTVLGRPVRVGKEPTAITVANGMVWVALSDGAIVRIDSRSSQPLPNRIEVGGVPTALLPRGKVVWVSDAVRNAVMRFDSRTGARVGAPVRVGATPVALAAGFNGIWVANGDDGTVTRIDERTARVVGTPVLVGTDPAGIATAAGRVWVSNSSDDALVSVDPGTNRLVGNPIPVGHTPLGLAAAGATLFVVTESSDELVQVDAVSRALRRAPVEVGRAPASVAVGAGGIWVANQDDDSVSFIAASGL